MKPTTNAALRAFLASVGETAPTDDPDVWTTAELAAEMGCSGSTAMLRVRQWLAGGVIVRAGAVHRKDERCPRQAYRWVKGKRR